MNWFMPDVIGGGQMAPVDAIVVPVLPPVVDPTPTPTPVPPVAGLTKPGQLGFNLASDWAQAYTGGTFVWLDRMKSSGCNSFWQGNVDEKPPLPAPPVDAYGYLTGFGAHTFASTFVSVRVPAAGQAAVRHVLRHNGSTDFAWLWVGLNNIAILPELSTPNRVVFDVGPYVNGQSGSPLLMVTALGTTRPTYREGDPIETRDGIAVYELAHETAYLAGETVHPAWKAAHVDTFVLRPMDELKINHSGVKTVADRTPVGSMSYSRVTPWGAPLERMVDLCNAVGAHMHLCVPHAADMSWVTWAFAYIRDHLDPKLLLEVEYSNEVWNPGFLTQFLYAANFWRDQTGQSPNNRLGYGYLAARNVKRARDVFGPAQAHRVFGLYVGQAGNIASFEQARPGAEAFEGKKLRDYFGQVSGAFYLNGGAQELINPEATAEQLQAARDEMLRFEATGPAGSRVPRQQLIDQIRHGNAIPGWPNTGTLDGLAPIVDEMCGFARLHHIPHVGGYEGQLFHNNANGPMGDDAGRFVEMMWVTANDLRVCDIQPGSVARDEHMMMRSKGMTCQTIFVDFGYRDQYGSWLSKESSVAPDTPLWSFYRFLQKSHPDPVLFEINMTGGVGDGLGLTAGTPSKRMVTSFGGLMPAAPVTIKSGGVPGMTLVDGIWSGTPTTIGSYPVVFSAIDAGGREITITRTMAVAETPPGFRFWRYMFLKNGAGQEAGTFFARFGSDEFRFGKAAGPIAPVGFVATTNAYDGHDPQRCVDGSTTASFMTQAMGNGGPADPWVHVDVGAGNAIEPTYVDIFACSEATPYFDPIGIRIERSNDGAAWTTVANVPDGLVYASGYTRVPLASG